MEEASNIYFYLFLGLILTINASTDYMRLDLNNVQTVQEVTNRLSI